MIVKCTTEFVITQLCVDPVQCMQHAEHQKQVENRQNELVQRAISNSLSLATQITMKKNSYTSLSPTKISPQTDDQPQKNFITGTHSYGVNLIKDIQRDFFMKWR